MLSQLINQVKTSHHKTTNPALIYVWVYFNLVPNIVLLPILVATFIFSKTATRHPTLINACITWILSGIFTCLLYFAGEQFGPEPNKALCIAQSSLLYGITPMWAVAILMLVYHMTVSPNRDRIKTKFRRTKLCIMLAAPYIAQISFSVAALILSLKSPSKVTRKRRALYCSLKYNILSTTMSTFTLTVCIIITAMEGYLAIMLYRNWRVLHSAGLRGVVDPKFILRVLVFGIYIFFGMIVSLMSMFDERSHFPDIFAATVGLVLFLIFGTQADVFRAWCFWRRAPESVKPTPQEIATDASYPDLYDQNGYNPDAKEVGDVEKTMWTIVRPENAGGQDERVVQPFPPPPNVGERTDPGFSLS